MIRINTTVALQYFEFFPNPLVFKEQSLIQFYDYFEAKIMTFDRYTFRASQMHASIH